MRTTFAWVQGIGGSSFFLRFLSTIGAGQQRSFYVFNGTTITRLILAIPYGNGGSGTLFVRYVSRVCITTRGHATLGERGHDGFVFTGNVIRFAKEATRYRDVVVLWGLFFGRDMGVVGVIMYLITSFFVQCPGNGRLAVFVRCSFSTLWVCVGIVFVGLKLSIVAFAWNITVRVGGVRFPSPSGTFMVELVFTA